MTQNNHNFVGEEVIEKTGQFLLTSLRFVKRKVQKNFLLL